MGLDMYLKKKTFIGANYDHMGISGELKLTANGKPINIKLRRVSTITEEIGYWRKANHIHKWFVDNIQNGIDDCGDYYVSKKSLEKLLSDCKNVLNNKHLAESVLPTKSGFFFGETEYDEYYFNDIKNTIEIIESAILEEGGDIYYSSSW